jgi:hypothetical protein
MFLVACVCVWMPACFFWKEGGKDYDDGVYSLGAAVGAVVRRKVA